MVEPTQDDALEVDRKPLGAHAKIHLSRDVRPHDGMGPGADDEPLLCGLGTASVLAHAEIVAQRPTQENVIPAADEYTGRVDLVSAGTVT